MQPSLDIRRHSDGSIDLDFLRGRALHRRRQVRRLAFKRLTAAIVRAADASVSVKASLSSALPSRRDGVRPLLGGSVIAAAVLAGAALHAWAQANHAHHIVVLPEQMTWAPGPPSLPAGAQVVMLEGNPAKAEPLTMRMKFPAGYRVAPHTHPAIEHVTVLSGTLHIGAGDTFDRNGGKRLPAGSFAAMPTGMPHFVWTSEETVIQMHSVGPWGITYVNPADDPRKQ
jgi:quercetin dioxygenase-like cupin family protein